MVSEYLALVQKKRILFYLNWSPFLLINGNFYKWKTQWNTEVTYMLSTPFKKATQLPLQLVLARRGWSFSRSRVSESVRAVIIRISTNLYHKLHSVKRSSRLFRSIVLKMSFVPSDRASTQCCVFLVLMLIPRTGMYSFPFPILMLV